MPKKTVKKIDKKDRRILDLLQKNARITNFDISKDIKLAPSATLIRVRRLENDGVIESYSAKLNESLFNYGSLSFIWIKTINPSKDAEFVEKLQTIPEVLEIHEVSGEFTYLVKVRTHDTHDLSRIIKEEIGQIDNVSSVNSVMTLKTFKESTKIPLDTQ